MRSPLPGRRLARVGIDVVLAASLAAWGLAEVWGSGAETLRGPEWANAAVYAVMSLLLLARRRVPVAVLSGQCLMLSALVAAYGSSETLGWLLPLLAGIYGVADYATRRVLGAAVPVVSCLVVMAVADAARGIGADPLGTLPFLGLMLLAWLFGDYARTRRLYVQQLAAAAELAAREREQAALLRRARIARELHDVLAHGLTVMVRQVEAGQARLDTDPDRARASFDAVAHAGRQSLHEVRRVVALLRDGTEEPAGVGSLALLADEVTRTGLAVELRQLDDVSVVPDGLGLTIYRIVQEALTNAMRHGLARSATVTLSRTPEPDGGVVVEIRDDGAGVSGPIVAGGGLSGMRERAALYGGELNAGAGESGGFVVRAVLPLAAA